MRLIFLAFFVDLYVHDKNPIPVQGVSISVEGVGIGLDFGALADEASGTYNGYYKWEP